MPADVQRLVETLQARHPQNAVVDFVPLLEGVEQVFYSHADFLAYYKQIDADFIYDKTANLYLVRVTGRHVDLLAALFRYYGGECDDTYGASDQFVLSGLGLFKSRAGHRIYRSVNFQVDEALRPIYRDIEVLT